MKEITIKVLVPDAISDEALLHLLRLADLYGPIIARLADYEDPNEFLKIKELEETQATLLRLKNQHLAN